MKTTKIILAVSLLGLSVPPVQAAPEKTERPSRGGGNRPDSPGRGGGNRPDSPGRGGGGGGGGRPDGPRPRPDNPGRPNNPSRPDNPGRGGGGGRPHNPGRPPSRPHNPPSRPSHPSRPPTVIVNPPAHHDHHYYDRHPGYYDDNIYAGTTECSPAVQNKSVNAVESRLDKVVGSAQFAKADTLKATLADIRAEKHLGKKIAAYCDLVGVNSRDPKQVLEFIGARDNSRYVKLAQRDLKLTTEQANVLVREISTTLRSGINK